MPTLLQNNSEGPLVLPPPYNGVILPRGYSVTLLDDIATVRANLGPTTGWVNLLPLSVASSAGAISGAPSPYPLTSSVFGVKDLLPQAALSAAISAQVTSIPLTSTVGLASFGQVKIENEIIVYTSLTQSTLEGAIRGSNGTTQAAHAINVAVQQFTRVIYKANTGGSDITGDGSAAKPFRTWQRLCRFISEKSIINPNGIYLGDCTGLGKEILPAEFVMPPFLNNSVQQTTPGGAAVGVFLASEGGVNFFATPTTVFTLTDAMILCKTNGAVLVGDLSITVVDTTGFTAIVAETVADNPLLANAQTINVTTSTASFPAFGIIKIENELIAYNAKTATSFTGCLRGFNGTTAASHAATTAIASVGMIKIDNEIITYSAMAATTFSGLNRGAFGTTAAAHTTATRVLLTEEDGMVKYVTNQNLANYQGYFVMGTTNGQFACIANDTTGPNSVIEVPATANWMTSTTTTLVIGSASAELNRNTQAPRSAVLQSNSAAAAGINIAGFKFTSDLAGTNPAGTGLEFTSSNNYNFNMCDMDVSYNNVRSLFPSATGCILRRQMRLAGSGGLNSTNCVFLNVTLRQGGTIFTVRPFQCIFIGCTPVGQGNDFQFSTTKGSPSPSGSMIQNCRIRGGTSHGILLEAGGKIIATNVSVKSCVGSGAMCSAPGVINTLVLVGYGNGGAGLRTDDGGRILIDDNATQITGTTGDLKCGGMTVRDLLNFRATGPTKNMLDVPGFTGNTPDTSTGSRISQL